MQERRRLPSLPQVDLFFDASMSRYISYDFIHSSSCLTIDRWRDTFAKNIRHWGQASILVTFDFLVDTQGRQQQQSAAQGSCGLLQVFRISAFRWVWQVLFDKFSLIKKLFCSRPGGRQPRSSNHTLFSRVTSVLIIRSRTHHHLIHQPPWLTS